MPAAARGAFAAEATVFGFRSALSDWEVDFMAVPTAEVVVLSAAGEADVVGAVASGCAKLSPTEVMHNRARRGNRIIINLLTGTGNVPEKCYS